MATKLEIINAALAYLGNPSVNTLNLANQVVATMSSIYDQMLPDMLSTHPWRFAMKWETLVQLPDDPTDPHWNYSYQLPGDYIQAYDTYPWGNYTIVTDRIVWANINPPWKWGYVASVNEGLFPPYFTKLMSYGLASECAMLVTETPQIAQYWDGKTAQQRVLAQNRDSTAQPNPVIRDNRLWARHLS